MKIFGGVHSFGKGAQLDVVKYYVFWTTINLVLPIKHWLYIAVQTQYFPGLLRYLAPADDGAEAKSICSNHHTQERFFREASSQKSTSRYFRRCIFFGTVSFGILWALPVFNFATVCAEGDLLLGSNRIYTYIYGSPLASIAAMLNMHFAGIYPCIKKK